MEIKILMHIFLTFLLFQIIKSKDNHTLSNYEDITLTNLTGIFYPDFDAKIVKGNLNYTFHSNVEGSSIILDTFHLNIIAIHEIDQGNMTKLDFSFGETDEKLGTPLNISITFENNTEIQINIEFNTTPEGGAAQFLENSQTVGGDNPYFFTLSALTYGRELLPSQDTPAVKFPFYLGIKVMNPLKGMISGLYVKEENNTEDKTTTYYYEQKIPIPIYLIALVAGNIAERKINENISVYSEPEFVDQAYKEFNDTPTFLEYAISYMGDYLWGKYNILVLPHSFPYSGMENPCLTFTSPCLVNGDKSLVDLIAHELIHSWSGNLVTNENWRDFWLNEGITKFLQRKVIAQWAGDDYAKMDYMLGLSYISKYLKIFGENNTLTSLRPDLTGMRPDESFSNIPYEKGSNFIYYIEDIVGNETMKNFFQSYFNKYAYKSIDVYEFMKYFKEFCNETGVNTDSIEWNKWIFEPGDCPYPNNFSNKYDDQLQEVFDKFVNGALDDLEKEFTKLTSTAKTVFFLRLEDRNIFLTDEQHDFLTQKLKLYKDQNFLVTTHYLRLILKETDKFYEGELECLENYLKKYGVSDFMDGVYRLFYKRDEIRAEEILKSCKDFYHIVMYDMAEREINDAKKTFPIFSIDLKEEKCSTFPIDNKILVDMKLNDEIEYDIPPINLTEEIELISEDNCTVDLECFIDFNENYCLVKENITNPGKYKLSTKERIQKKEYAIKKYNSSKSYNIFMNDIIVDENLTNSTYEIDFGEINETTIVIYFSSEPNQEVLLKNDGKVIDCQLNNTSLECSINSDVLEFDKKNPKEYNLKLVDICDTEKYKLTVRAKNSKYKEDNDDDGDDGISTLAIVLICIGGAILLSLIIFFVYRTIRKRKDNDIKIIDIKEDRILEDQ